MLNQDEILWPLNSIGSYITEDLIVYPMSEKQTPIIEKQFNIGEVASGWIERLDKDDDDLISEMIYWFENEI